MQSRLLYALGPWQFLPSIKCVIFIPKIQHSLCISQLLSSTAKSIKMFSKFNNGGSQEENYCPWNESMGFSPALSQEEEDALWSTGMVQPDMQPSLEYLVPASVTCNEIEASTSIKRLELRFLTRISSPVFSGKKIKGKECGFIEIGLFDSTTGKLINSGPESSAEVAIVALKEVFDSVRDNDWMPEEFDQNIVTEWKNKKSLLAGTRKLKLKEGMCILENVSFTHNKHWFGKSKFRLGVRIVKNFNGVRVREAKTEPFELKDRRLEWNKKCCSPSLSDEVWRLKKINRNGPRDTRLREANIKTVKDFLILLFFDTQKLRKIYGSGGKDWEATVSHARMCTDKMVCYLSSSRKQTGTVVSATGEVLGLLSKDKSIHMDLSGFEKANAHKLVMSAFEHPENVESFDDEKDLIHESPQLTNAPIPSNSPSHLDHVTMDMFDNHNDHDTLSLYSGECYRPMVDNHNDQTQPSTSYHDTLSWFSGECYSPCASTSKVPNTLMNDPWFSDFETQNSEYYEAYGWVSNHVNQVDELKDTGESTRSVGAGEGLFGMAQKRWKKLSSIWFSMRSFVKKIGSTGGATHKLMGAIAPI